MLPIESMASPRAGCKASTHVQRRGCRQKRLAPVSTEIAGPWRVRVGRGRSVMRMRILPHGHGSCRDDRHGEGLRRHGKERGYADGSTAHRLVAAAVATLAIEAITVSRGAHARRHDLHGRHLAGLKRGQIHAQGDESSQQQCDYPSSGLHAKIRMTMIGAEHKPLHKHVTIRRSGWCPGCSLRCT